MKFTALKKEKEKLVQENKSLSEEITNMQSNLRQMIPGFSNTSSTFPMLNELITLTNEFYKYDCLDLFFDLLCPELNLKGIVYFFSGSFIKTAELIQKYFEPLEKTIKSVGCLENIEGPIMNVLRKSFQSNYKQIFSNCLRRDNLYPIVSEIQKNLKLGGESEETNEQIYSFISKLAELLFCFYACDPPLSSNKIFFYFLVQPKSIGNIIYFNPLKEDPLDGFIKPKDESILVLPSLTKQNSDEILVKALIIASDYEIPN